MENIRRVFFHELGHFVANQINKLHLSGSGTEKILLYLCHQNSTIYCGMTSPVVPDRCDRTSPPPKNRLPKSLLSAIYGCIFQAYERDESLRKCLDENGDDDYKCWESFLMFHKISSTGSALFEFVEDYLEMIRKEKALEEFLLLNPDDYLIQTSKNNYRIDLDLLQSDTFEMVKNHSFFYLKLIEKFEDQINNAKPFIPNA